jgi:CubicO group peptidase (beta-lactamase class C family)
MQDYETTDGEYVDGEDSVHAAYPFRLTARDMARFGLLYLRNGNWCRRQIISEKWIKESTTVHSITNYKNGVGYGYLWWVSANGKVFPNTTLKEDAFYAWGTGGHYIFVIPELSMVIVNRVNTDVQGKRINDDQFGELVRQILEARNR